MDPKYDSQELTNLIFFMDKDQENILYTRSILLNPKDHRTYLQWAFHLGKESWTKAYEKGQRAIQLDPSDDYSYTRLALILQRNGQHEKALDCFKWAVDRNLGSKSNIHQYGMALINLKKYEELDTLYHRVVEHNSLNDDMYQDLIEALILKRNYAEADLIYAKAIEADPSNESLYIKWADLFLRQNKIKEAEEKYAKGAQMVPTSVKIFERWGRLLMTHRKYSEAEEVLANALKLEEKMETYEAYISNFYDQRKCDEVNRMCEIATSKFPDNHVIYHLWANALRHQEKFEEAETKYLKSSQLNDQYRTNYYNWGNMLVTQRKYKEAKEKFYKMIENNPRSFDAYLRLIEISEQLQEYENLEELCEKAISVNSISVIVYAKWGLCLFKQNRFKEATEKFEKAIELDPRYTTGHNYLGLVLYHLMFCEEAKKCFARVVELDETDSSGYMNLGLTLYHLQDEEGAIEMYQKAVEIFKGDPQEKERAVMCYSETLKQAEEALMSNKYNEEQKRFLEVKIGGLKTLLALLT